MKQSKRYLVLLVVSEQSFYLNDGGLNISAKSRQSRFYYNNFEQSKPSTYHKPCTVDKCNLNRTLNKGDRMKLPQLHTKNAKRFRKITGTVQ